MTTHPINQFVKKCAPDKFELTDDQFAVFKTFIDTVRSTPVLAIQTTEHLYAVEAEASEYFLGCTIFQTQEYDDL